MTGQPDGIGLDEALEALRGELAAARSKAAGRNVQFPVETVTVTLKVGATRTQEGKAGFRVPFVGAEVGGSASFDREMMQTVTIVLGSPVDRDGRAIKVVEATGEILG